MLHFSLCVQTRGWTALHLASKEGHVEISRTLVEGGAVVENTDKVGSYSYTKFSITMSELYYRLVSQLMTLLALILIQLCVAYWSSLDAR